MKKQAFKLLQFHMDTAGENMEKLSLNMKSRTRYADLAGLELTENAPVFPSQRLRLKVSSTTQM